MQSAAAALQLCAFIVLLWPKPYHKSLGALAGVNSLGDLGRLLEELPRPFVDFLKVQAIIRGAATKLGSSLHDRLRINATYAQKVRCLRVETMPHHDAPWHMQAHV